MRTIASVLGLFALVFLVQCQNQESTKAIADEELMAKGNNLLETNCYSCHSPDAGHESRIAPPMAAIKKHYTSLRSLFLSIAMGLMLPGSCMKYIGNGEKYGGGNINQK